LHLADRAFRRRAGEVVVAAGRVEVFSMVTVAGTFKTLKGFESKTLNG
jgi:hypothetical protein